MTIYGCIERELNPRERLQENSVNKIAFMDQKDLM